MHTRTFDSRRHRSQGVAEGVALALAQGLLRGRLTVHLHDGGTRVFEGNEAGPAGEISVRHPRLFRRLLGSGNIGLAESYIDGDWDSPDLTTLLALGAANEEVLGRTLAGRLLPRLASRLVHALRANSRRGSRRNIAAHYDLGNDFYAAWLDPSLTYSAGLFASPADDDLAAAQDRKYRRIAELAGIEPGHHVLEIGCGWGGFCIWAARTLGCRVTAITISREQHRHCVERVRAEGLEDRIELRLQDYRDLDGEYDAVVSIEMLEAVGEAYWPTYFDRLRACLRPGGRAALQVITIDDRRFPAYRRRADFIQRYIFPGGMLPPPTALETLVKDAGLTLTEMHRHGGDYARTLTLWRRRFERAWPEIAGSAPRFDERFRRLWRFYLAYCEAGFQAGRIDLLHLALQRDRPTP